jgi:hypothetical protein
METEGYRVRNSPPPVPILSQMNPIHIPIFPKIHLDWMLEFIEWEVD